MKKWTCPCGAKNKNSWEYCPQCGNSAQRSVDRYPESIYVRPGPPFEIDEGRYTVSGRTKRMCKYIRADLVPEKPQPTTNDTTELPKNMVLVRAGMFLMGSPESEKGRYDDETLHEVAISHDFYMSKYPVTQAEYERVVGHNPSCSSKGIGDDYPVYQVSWYDAVEYCNKLSELEGLTLCYSGRGENICCDWNANGYRLPTEAEWEYAARGGQKAGSYNVYAGSDTIGNVGWYVNNSGRKTHPVGGKQANELGIYDMSGNVWEWCWDRKGEYPTGGVMNPAVSSAGSNRVVRGGSWFSFANSCRSAYRSRDYPSNSYYGVGFRVVRTA